MRESNIASVILSGYDFLLDHLNDDAGVPAVTLGDPSGCWTTATAIEALVSIPYFCSDIATVKQIVEFLCDQRLRTPKRLAGSWALTVGGKQGSTLATAHSVIALGRAEAFHPLEVDFGEVVEVGLKWLATVQNEDGGWGVEPYGGAAGRSSRLVSTFLALRAFGEAGREISSSKVARLGANWVLSTFDGATGFPAFEGQKVDPCSSSRACIALEAVGALVERPGLLNAVANYLEESKPPGGLWNLARESYVPDGAPGQIFFNQNSTAELLGFFAEFNLFPEYQTELLRWFVKNQNENGSWFLGANEKFDEKIVTWPTADALVAIIAYLRCLGVTPEVESSQMLEEPTSDSDNLNTVQNSQSGDLSSNPHSSNRIQGVELANSSIRDDSMVNEENDSRSLSSAENAGVGRFWKYVAVVAIVISVLQLLLIVGLPNLVLQSWNQLPEGFRQSGLWTFVLGAASSLSATIMIMICIWVYQRWIKK